MEITQAMMRAAQQAEFAYYQRNRGPHDRFRPMADGLLRAVRTTLPPLALDRVPGRKNRVHRYRRRYPAGGAAVPDQRRPIIPLHFAISSLSTAAAYEEVSRTNALLFSDAKVRQTLAACFAVEACAEAVRFGDDVVGTASVRFGAPFERYFRDVHVLMQHATKSNGVYGTAGRALLGLEPDRFWFIF